MKVTIPKKIEDKKEDIINHPPHYNTGTIEVIDFIEDKNLNFHRATALKYIVRAGIKDKATEITDLKKAQWYIEREIKLLEGGTK